MQNRLTDPAKGNSMKTMVSVAAMAIALCSNLPAQIVSVPASAIPAGSALPIYGWLRLPVYPVGLPRVGSERVWGYPGFSGVFGLPIAGFSADSLKSAFVITTPPPKPVSEPAQQVAPPPPVKVKSVTSEYYWPSPDQITGSGVASEPRSSCR